MSTPQHKLLIVMYYWPPAGGPGVQRWLKLTKYLAKLGVKIYVVTVDPDKGTYPLKDQSLLADVDDSITIIRTDSTESFDLYKKFTRKKEVPFSGFANENEKPGFVQKLARFVRGNFFVPDARKGWNKHAYKAASDLIEKEGIQTVITSSPPHSTQLVGLKLKKNFNIRWISDFRDPWTDIYYYDLFYPTSFTRKRELKMEKDVMIAADQIISVSEQWGKLYASKDAKVDPSKIHIFPNGYDAHDFEGIQKKGNDTFTITYAGTITQQYPLDQFIAAIEKLAFAVKVRMIGRWDEKTHMRLSSLTSPIEVEWVEYLAKDKLNAELVAADLLLFILPVIESSTGHIPGKLFDYLGSGNPVLGYGPVHGDAANILHSTEHGKMFTYEEVDAIVEFISAVQNGSFKVNPTLKLQYERSNQATALLKLLNL